MGGFISFFEILGFFICLVLRFLVLIRVNVSINNLLNVYKAGYFSYFFIICLLSDFQTEEITRLVCLSCGSFGFIRSRFGFGLVYFKSCTGATSNGTDNITSFICFSFGSAALVCFYISIVYIYVYKHLHFLFAPFGFIAFLGSSAPVCVSILFRYVSIYIIISSVRVRFCCHCGRFVLPCSVRFCSGNDYLLFVKGVNLGLFW